MIERAPFSAASSFVVLKFKDKNALSRLPLETKWVPYEKRQQTEGGGKVEEEADERMLEDECLDGNESLATEGDLAPNDSASPPANEVPDEAPISTRPSPAAPKARRAANPRNARNKSALARLKRAPAATKPKRSGLHTPAHRKQRQAKSILKQEPSAGIRKTTKDKSKSVVVDPDVDIQLITDTPTSHDSNEENETPVTSPDQDSTSGADDDEMSDASSSTKDKRPSLKISFNRKPSVPTGGIQPAPVQTPGLQSATAKTPIINLKLKVPGTGTSTPTLSAGSKPKKPKKSKAEADNTDVTPGSNKKRKRESVAGDDGDEGGRAAPAPPGKPPTLRKLTFKNPQVAQTPGPKSTGGAQLLFKVKGKVPKRALGVGYDSELESEYLNEKKITVAGRELDPVIHEGFVLRMQPGEDADYLRKSIEEGKVGESIAKGGASINLRMLDTLGRRGILAIKDHKYATSLVDLPCIIEGMKSWDKKGWIKSVDICQMLLVLGRCKDEEEARNYPLPEDVDPQTYQYAHGLTAPMKWVRKRRFARTKRARVDDIEAIERRVHALLEADKAAVSSRYQLLDHDPRLDEHGYSTDMEDENDSDAEGEIDNYFDYHPGAYNVSTPMLTETPVQEEIGEDDVAALEAMFFDEDKVPASEPSAQAQVTLHPPELAGESSFAVTSTSATPSATAEPTPAGEASSDEDEDDAAEDDEDRDDAEKEGDENKRQALERIEDMTNKISEQRELLKKTTNAILKKKLARRIQDLEDDVAMMKKNAGLADAEDDE